MLVFEGYLRRPRPDQTIDLKQIAVPAREVDRYVMNYDTWLGSETTEPTVRSDPSKYEGLLTGRVTDYPSSLNPDPTAAKFLMIYEHDIVPHLTPFLPKLVVADEKILIAGFCPLKEGVSWIIRDLPRGSYALARGSYPVARGSYALLVLFCSDFLCCYRQPNENSGTCLQYIPFILTHNFNQLIHSNPQNMAYLNRVAHQTYLTYHTTLNKLSSTGTRQTYI